MPKSTKSYSQLLDQLKASQGKTSEVQAQVSNILKELNADLKNVNLFWVDLEKAISVVEAKFDESGFTDAKTMTEQPKNRDAIVAATTVGNYPTAAFNVEIAYENESITIFVWPVPEDGNLR